MTELSMRQRSIWEDRFRTPTWDELKAESNKQVGGLLEAARDRLRAAGLRENLAWQGIPWRWCMVYRTEAEANRPACVVVPQPNKPRLALPLPIDVVGQLPMRKLSKGLRDGIVHAPEVSGVRWPSWEFQSKAQLDELLVVLQLRLNLSQPAGV